MFFLDRLLIISLLRLSLTISFINIYCFSSSVYGLRIVPPYTYPPKPQIWMSEYSEADSYDGIPAEKEFQTLTQFENEFISKNGTDYVLHDDLNVVVFTCQAKYPIKWEVPDLTQFPGIAPYFLTSIMLRISDFPEKAVHPVNKYFKSYLILYPRGLQFFSATFTCKDIVPPKRNGPLLSNSFHLYFEAYEILENEGKTVSVSLDLSLRKLAVVLPCRPALPDIHVTLEREVDGEWNQVASKQMSFDPKVGFKFKRFHWGKKFLGLYRCTVNGSAVGRDSDVVVLLNVTSGDARKDGLSSERFEPHSNLKGNATVFRNGSSLDSFWCCSGVSGGEPPKLHIESCQEKLECEIAKSSKRSDQLQLYHDPDEAKDNCSRTNLYASPSIIRCEADDIDYVGEFVEVLRPGMASFAKREASWKGKNSTEEFSYYEKSMSIYLDSEKANEVSVEEKMMISIGRNIELDDIVSRSLHFYGINSFDNNDMSNSALSSYSSPDPEHWEQDRVLEYSRNSYFEGEPLTVMCFGLRYFYSVGGHLRVNWKNGSQSIVERAPYGKGRTVSFYGDFSLGSMSGGFSFHSIFGKEIKANLDMESVDCFLPVWNTAEWDTVRYNLSVRISTPPKFEGGEEDEETVYFYLNDTNKEISWKVLEGQPFPRLQVTKDGKKLPKNYFENEYYNGLALEEEEDEIGDETGSKNGTNIITIKFKSVTYEVAGNYSCTAENVKGNSTKIIKVIVVGKQSSIAGPVSIACVAILIALLLGIGIVFRIQLGQMWKLRRFRL